LFPRLWGGKFPHEHKDNLVSELGTDKAQVVEQEIAALINEINQHPIDWTEHSLVSAGELVIKTMAERHPELSDAALRALAWKFTFDWR